MAPQKSKSYPFWLGGAASSMAACVTHPLDFMRVYVPFASYEMLQLTLRRMQTSTKKMGFVGAARDVIRTSGFRTLYTGLTASIFRQMTYSMTRFGAYERLKGYFSNQGQKKLGMGESLLCASISGAMGGLAGNPADIILVRMIADPSKPPDQRVHYRNAIQGLYSMISHEGISSIFRGLLPNTIRAIIMNSGQLVSYDYFKSILLSKTDMKDGMGLHIVSSALAGTVATTMAAPADVVKSRVMNMRKGSGGPGIVSLIGQALKNEGPMFLFKGWLPAWKQLRNATDFVRSKTSPGTLQLA